MNINSIMLRTDEIYDSTCNNAYKLLLKYKFLILLLLFIFTPLVVHFPSVYALGSDAINFTIILTILLYVAYLNVFFAKINYKIAIVIVFLISFLIQLFISSQFFGTYDVESFYIDAEILDKDITANFYHANRWNYAPTYAYIIHFVNQISQIASIPLSTLVKVPVIIFNVLVAVLLYRLVKRNKQRKKEAFRVISSFLYNPILILVTAYGAQFDMIAIYFLLLYYYLDSVTKNRFRHLIYGFSIAVKQVTVFPIVFLMLSQKGTKKLQFLVMSSIPFIVLISPYFFGAIEPIMRSVFSYKGVWALWGYTRIIQYFTTLFGLFELQFFLHAYLGKVMVVVLFAAMFYFFNKFKKISMLEGILISFLFFFVLGPGFGTQYLVWMLPFAVLFKNNYYYVYSFLGTFVAFFFYYGSGLGNLIYREIIAYSLFGPMLWLFSMYWLWRMYKEINKRHQARA